MRRKLLIWLFIVLFVAGGALAVQAQGELEVYFFDVGQAEAALLKSAQFTMLIDAAAPGTDLVNHLHGLGVEVIDLFVITHPHADHIGQAVQVLKEFEVQEVWMSGYEHSTLLFEGVLDAVLASDADYYEPRQGETFEFGELTVEVLNPPGMSTNLHATNIVVRVVCGELALLFTGDAERRSETEMLSSGLPLTAQVLQLGHHGSRTSSSLDFLVAVDPVLAVYSAGAGNEFGHPHGEVLDRLKILGIPVYGTDVYGTIVLRTDGSGFSLHTARSPLPGAQAVGCVDLNTASLEELQRIVHIGPERALEIVGLRPLSSVDELAKISGIGPARLADIKKQGLACVKGVVED